MSGNAKGKLRTLYIMQMLQDETDDEHGLSMTAIISRLADLGMTADRKTVYTDLDTLREFGLHIGTAQRNPVEYYLESRDFKFDELMLMVDAVQSCRFITQTQADRMCRTLRRLATDSQREKLERRIHVDDRVRGRNDAVLSNVEKIHEAMRGKRKIGYTYWKMGTDGKLHARYGGEVYVVSPMLIAFSENHYYLTAWSDKYQEVREYRIDRMRDLQILPDKMHRCQEMDNYVYQVRDSQYFDRFDGPVSKVTLHVDEDLMSAVYDHFGEDADVFQRDDGAADVHVSVRVSPPFFGWVAGLGKTVKITAPGKVVDEYHDYLRALLED